jgi:hypothetical protein
MKSVARRVVDRRVLHLVKMWLNAPVEENERGRKKRTTANQDTKQGNPSRFANFTPTVESIPATVYPGVEADGLGAAAWCTNRQLR